MPDITMCAGKDCTLKETCYRHTATPSEYHQSYFLNPPIKEDKCDHYWEMGMSSKVSKKLDKK